MQPGPQRYEPGLDGLRALALLAVLAYHGGPSGGGGSLGGGFLGVSTFFTLSGFLITSLLLREHAANGAVSLRSFFARRARRLLPAAILGVGVAALVTSMRHDPQAAQAFRGDAFGALTNVANWRFVFARRSYAAQFAAPSALLHFWSLAVEEQFYLVLAPLLAVVVALTRARRARLLGAFAALTAGSFGIGIALVAHHANDRAYYGTDARAAEFLMGTLLAVLVTSRTLSPRVSRSAAVVGPVALGLLAFANAHVHLNDYWLFRGGLIGYAALTSVVIVAACVRGPVRSVLSWSPLRALGRISYGAYVYHWPLFLLIDARRTGLSPWALTAARVSATIAIATVSFLLIEQPIRQGRLVKGRQRFVAVPAAFVGLLVTISLVGTVPAQGAIHFEPVAVRPAIRSTVQDRSTTTHTTRAVPEVQRVLVVGDSVALTLGRGIERWGARHGVDVRNYGRLGCGLLDGAAVRGYWGIETRTIDPCHLREQWAKVVAEFHPDVVVALFGAWDVYDASWDGGQTWWAPGSTPWNGHYAKAVVTAAHALAASGAQVLWLEPPCFASAPDANDSNAAWFSPRRPAAIGAIERDAAARDGFLVSDVVQRAGCPVDLAARPDGVHYSDAGADAIAPAVGRAIERAQRFAHA